MQPEGFVLYLDENLCNCRALLDALAKNGVPFVRHLDLFPRGTPDEKWLPDVGKNGWILLTADKQLRYNLLEMRALRQYKVRTFTFASGNLSGQQMAERLVTGLPKMRRLCRRVNPTFIAVITGAGEVHVRWPKPGQNRSS